MASGYPDFEGQKSKLFTVADWAAVEATDKNINGGGLVAKSFGQDQDVSYTVPAGTTLYITQIYCSNRPAAAADGDKNQIGDLSLLIAGLYYIEGIGFNGGTFAVLTKPAVATAGQAVIIRGKNLANHNTKIYGGLSGYEI